MCGFAASSIRIWRHKTNLKHRHCGRYFKLVEHIGFEPMTSSMPWKRASQLRQCPVQPRYVSTKIASFPEAMFVMSCCAPTRGCVCFLDIVFVSVRTGEPRCAPANTNMIACGKDLYKLMLVFLPIIWLTKYVSESAMDKIQLQSTTRKTFAGRTEPDNEGNSYG